MNERIRDKVLRRLAEGPATFSGLRVSMMEERFREVDGTLQKMRRAGLIQSLPRQRGVRPIAEWALPAPLSRKEDQT